MIAPEIPGMALDLARELIDRQDAVFEVEAECDGGDAWGFVDDITSIGTDIIERWLQRAYELGRKSANPQA